MYNVFLCDLGFSSILNDKSLLPCIKYPEFILQVVCITISITDLSQYHYLSWYNATLLVLSHLY